MKKEATQYTVIQNGVVVFRGSNVDAKAEYSILEDRDVNGARGIYLRALRATSIPSLTARDATVVSDGVHQNTTEM